MRLSSRSAIDEGPSLLGAALERVREQRPDAIDLTLSNPTRAGLSYAAFGPLLSWTGIDTPSYAPDPLGLSSARQAIARHWPDQERPVDMLDRLSLGGGQVGEQVHVAFHPWERRGRGVTPSVWA